MFLFPDNLGYKQLKSMVESLPNSHDTAHSRKHYIVEGFCDDFGNIVMPYKLENFINRYNFFKETLA